MSLRVSVLFVWGLLLALDGAACTNVNAQNDNAQNDNAQDDNAQAIAEDQELPPPANVDMELPPPLGQPEIISVAPAGRVVDPQLNRSNSQPPASKVWVGAKLANDQPRILSIVENSPAVMAKLAVGDVIDSVNYRHVTRTAEVVELLRQRRPGDIVDVIIVRGNVRRLHRIQLAPAVAR